MASARPKAGKSELPATTFWRRAFFATTLFSVVFLFPRVLDWRTSGDDGYYYYLEGMRTWSDILSQLFLPSEKKVFVFGEVRPFQYLFYKTAYELRLGNTGFHVFAFLLAWLSCMGFSWGIVSLARLALPIQTAAIWFLSCLLFWAPSQTFAAAHNLCDIWLLGFVGVFWGLVYAEKSTLPARLRQPALRYGLAALAVLLALQTHEASWVLLGWSTIWIFFTKLKSMKKDLKPALKAAALPVSLAILHILLYRSLSPGERNRFEIHVSTDLASMLKVSVHYLVMGFYAIAHPITDWLKISPTAYGVGSVEYPISAILCATGMAGLLLRKGQKGDRMTKLSWLILAGGVITTIPYLVIVNRQLVYYSLRLNAFVSAFFAIRCYLDVKGKAPLPWFKPLTLRVAAFAYFFGVAYAGWNAIAGWNMVEYFSKGMIGVYDRAVALPGASDCTGENPCCLEIAGSTWGNNVWMVDWLDGAPRKPRFVEPGMPCQKTLKM